MKRWLDQFWHAMIQLGLVVLIIVALYSGLGRQVVRFYVLHPDRLSPVIMWLTGMNVHVEQMTARWQGLSPDLRFEHVRWQFMPGRPPVQIQSIEMDPNLLASLHVDEPRLHLRIQGLTLHLRQGTDRRWYFDELAQKASDPGQWNRFIRLVVRQPAIDLVNINLDVFTPRKHGVISGVNLHYRNDFRSSVLHAEAQLPSSLAPRQDRHLSLSVLAKRNLGGHWRAYIHLPFLQADDVLPDLNIPMLQSVRSRADIWMEGLKNSIQKVYVVLNSVHADVMGPGKSLHLDAPQLRIGITNTGSVLKVWTNQLNLRVNHQHIQTGALEWNRYGMLQEFAIEHTELGTWMDFCRAEKACASRLSPEVRALKVQGNLDRLAVRWQLPMAIQNFSGIETVAAAVHDLDISPLGAWPGVHHIDAELHGSGHQLWMNLVGKQAEYDDPLRFSQPIALDQYQIHLHASFAGEGVWSLDVPSAELANRDAHLEAALSLRKTADMTAPVLSLKASLSQGDVGQAWRYLPQNLLGRASINWVREALTAGRIDAGEALYEGRLQADESPSLSLHFLLRDSDLHDAPDWPVLHAMGAELGFDHGVLHLEHGQAKWQQTQIQDVSAQLESDAVGSEVKIQGHLVGPAHDIVDYLDASPLQRTLQHAFSGWNLSAPSESSLALTVPLDTRPVQVSADVHVLPGSLHLDHPAIGFDNVQGHIHYDTSRALSAQLGGVLWGEPMDAVMRSSVSQGEIRDISLSVHGVVSIQSLSKTFVSPFWSSLHGATSWFLDSHWRPGKSTDLYTLHSDMTGLEIDAPEPFAKGRDVPWPLMVIASVGPQDTRVHVRMGERLGAALVLSHGDIQSGRISLGPNTALGWPAHPGISVQGSLDTLDLDKWSAFIKPIPLGNSESCCSIQRFDLHVHSLDVLGHRLSAVHLQGSSNHEHDWSVHMMSQRLSADAMIPGAPTRNMPIDLHVHQLFWPIPATPGSMPMKFDAFQKEPPLHLDIDALHVPSEPDMQVRLLLLLGQGSVDIPQFYWQVPGVSANGTMHWDVGRSTHLVADFDSHDISKVFELFDAVPTLDAEETRMHVDLHWPGAPTHPALVNAEGTCSLHVSKGRILQVSKAASASRVFGLFNFADLGRRLRLDFSDLVHKGVSFDHLDAENQLEVGQIQVQSFVLKGPALTVKGSGLLLIKNEQMNMNMQVTVPVTRVVPVAVAVVAGPVVGGAALAAQALFGKPLDKLTTVRYHLSGDWNAPVVKLVGAGLHVPVRLPIELPFDRNVFDNAHIPGMDLSK